MIYPAIVVDNTKFLKFGYIKIRTPKFHPTASFDLKRDFPGSMVNAETIGDSNIDYDIKAYVLSPIGGGRNYGFFHVPQIGTRGYVFFINNHRSKAIWLGNVFEPFFDQDRKVTHINIPSDKEEDGEDTDGSIAKEKNIDGDAGTIILRQKSTRLETDDVSTLSADDVDKIDMQKLPTENLIVLDNKRVQVKHFIRDEEDLSILKKQEFEINTETENEEFISLKTLETEVSETSVLLKNKSLNISTTDIESEAKSTIEMTPEKTEISVAGDASRKIIIDNENGDIIINNDDAVTVKIDKDGNVIFDGAKSIQFNGTGDNLVKYSDLKSIIDAFAEHIHIAPNGPTEGPLISPFTPIGTKINQPSTNMKSETLQVE